MYDGVHDGEDSVEARAVAVAAALPTYTTDTLRDLDACLADDEARYLQRKSAASVDADEWLAAAPPMRR